MVEAPGRYRMQLLASIDNTSNTETVRFTRKMKTRVSFTRQRLQEEIRRHTSSTEIAASATASGKVKVLEVKSDARYQIASTAYRQHTESLRTESKVEQEGETEIVVPVGRGVKLDIYQVVVEGPAGVLNSESFITVPGGGAVPPVPEFKIVFQLETTRFRIRNKESKMFLLAGSWGKNHADRKVWQYPESEKRDGTMGFVWELLPDGRIQNVESRMFLLAGSWGENTGDRLVWQYPETEKRNGLQGFQWDILPDGRIKNRKSGLYLLAGSWGTQPGDRLVWQYPETEVKSGKMGFQWELLPAS